ncbi:NUDIX hydrolase [Candidatus Micrarchaeota archaeon]|nr:NUDIX hydrolase [Candidatus Micrarchaeota archaeon]
MLLALNTSMPELTKRGPWTVLGTAIKYENPWIKVREDKVIRPDGKPGIHAIVEVKPGVSVLPLDGEGFVYLTKEFHYGVNRESLEVVSGGIEEKETPIEAAKRELLEELGIAAETWTDLGQVDPFTTIVVSPTKLFLARKLSFTKARQEGSETIKASRMKFEEALRKVMASEITHSSSCVLILKANEYLKR